MQTEIVTLSSVKREVKASYSAQEVDQAFSKMAKIVGGQARLPGFRPGKAPTDLVMSRYGDEIRQKVTQDLMEKAVTSALVENKITPLGPVEEPAAAVLMHGSPFNFSVTFEIRPEIKLGDYKGLKLDKPKVEVTDAEINKELERLQKRGGQLVPLLVRDILEENDYAVLDTELSVDGQAIENGASKEQVVELDRKNDFIPGFIDALLGMKVGGERTFTLDYPEQGSNKDLAGKKVTYHVTLKQLRGLELPTIDDELAKDVGAPSLEELKKTLGDMLKARQEATIKAQLRQQVYDQLIASHPFEAPPSLVQRQTNNVLVDAIQRLGRQGVQPKLNPADLEELQKNYQPEAERTVRAGLLMGEVARAENIAIEDSDIEQHIVQLAGMNGQDVQRLRGMYADEERREMLRFQLLDEKVLDFLITHSHITDGPALPENERQLG